MKLSSRFNRLSRTSPVARLAFLLLVTSFGCADDTAGMLEPQGAPFDARDFSAGEFQLSVENVEDGCLDGTLQLLFMPDGTAAPYALQNTTLFPSGSELPNTVTVQLESPFSNLSMEMSLGADNTFEVKAGRQENLLLGLAGTGECKASLDFDATITVLDANTLSLETAVQLEGFSHPDCPAVQQNPCQVLLRMRGTRQ